MPSSDGVSDIIPDPQKSSFAKEDGERSLMKKGGGLSKKVKRYG
jgi:hypothetical protein